MFEALLSREDSRTRIAAQRARLRFINGLEWLLRDPTTIVGRTPYDVVMKAGKLVVRRYQIPGGHKPRHRMPVLLIPPLMVKPFIFDLRPGRSLVGHLLESGFRVYLVEFGEPDRADASVTLDDYVMDWIPSACRAVLDDVGSAGLSLLGYCMGGLFALCHAAVSEESYVRNIITIAAPVDTHKMGLFAWVARLGGKQIESMARHIGNLPGHVSSAAFHLLTPVKNVTRYTDLLMNMWDREYVMGFDAMNQWTSQFIDYPQEAFIQFMRDFMRKNKLIRGKLRFRDKTVDLRKIKASILAFAGETDNIAPEVAARGVLSAVAGDDVSFRLAPGGHMGVFTGSTAPEHVWQPAAEWLAQRSTVLRGQSKEAAHAVRR